jgi:hypothetical protein
MVLDLYVSSLTPGILVLIQPSHHGGYPHPHHRHPLILDDSRLATSSSLSHSSGKGNGCQTSKTGSRTIWRGEILLEGVEEWFEGLEGLLFDVDVYWGG